MKFHFFTITAQASESDQEALNAFCAQHRIVSVEKHFVTQGTESFWSICITYIEGTEKYSQSGKRERIDYKDVISPQDFAIYAELR